MASNQGPIQSGIMSQADVWDRVGHPARAAVVLEPLPEAAWDLAVPGREEAAAEDRQMGGLTVWSTEAGNHQRVKQARGMSLDTRLTQNTQS